jgi:hypothetical protein
MSDFASPDRHDRVYSTSATDLQTLTWELISRRPPCDPAGAVSEAESASMATVRRRIVGQKKRRR